MKNTTTILVVILLLFSTGVWAVERSPRITDREIVERLTRLEEGQKTLSKRIDDLDAKLNKRIDDTNKRIDDLGAKLNKRIDDLRAEMNGKFDTVNKRIDDLRAEMNSRFEAMDSRFKAMNSRFDTLQWMLGLFITISLVILGFVLRMQWQMGKRQTSMEATLKAHKEELDFLKSLIEKLLPPKGVL